MTGTRQENGHAVTLDGYRLNRYYALWEEPRPESYLEDVLAANGSRAVLRQLASVAETGWDFSSRRAPAPAEGQRR